MQEHRLRFQRITIIYFRFLSLNKLLRILQSELCDDSYELVRFCNDLVQAGMELNNCLFLVFNKVVIPL